MKWHSIVLFVFLLGFAPWEKNVDGQIRERLIPKEKNALNLTGAWRIDWDDQIDGKLANTGKRCFVKLVMKGQKLSGEFKGRVVGQQRDAKFTGEVFSNGRAPLIQLVQREKGYSCSYQIYWEPGPNKVPRGVWHDTRGASGEFSLLKFQ